jgi:hypothetical protein
MRGTFAGGITIDQSDATSAAADNATSKFTFAGGDPVALGLRVGHVIRFSSLSAAANNGKNFLITGFGGTSNREVSVYPAPATMSADTDFSLALAGQAVSVPASGHINRLFGIEDYNSDIDLARFFPECRIGSFNVNLPATGNSTVDFGVIGRGEIVYEDSNAPFFSGPAAVTTTPLCQAVNGLLMVNGAAVGVVTGVQFALDMSPQAPAVVGQNIPADILLGPARVTGQFSVFLEDSQFLDAFTNESDISMLCYLTGNNDDDAPALSFYLPRLKIGSAPVSDDGSGGKILQCNFQALKYEGAAPGVEQTTIQIHDTEVS